MIKFFCFFFIQVVNQDSSDKHVRITMKIPGLKVKGFITKIPKNGHIINTEYKNK